MNRVDYSYLLQQACDLCRLAPETTASSNPLRADDRRVLRNGFSQALDTAHATLDLPEWRRAEKRYFRPAWTAALACPAGTEVFHLGEQTYVQAVKLATGQDPFDSSGTLNTAYWALSAKSYGGDDWTATTALTVVGTIYRYPVDGLYYALHTAAATGTLPTDTSYFGVLTEFDPYILYAQTGETQIGEVLGVYDGDPQKQGSSKLDYRHHLSRNGVQVPAWPASVWIEFEERPVRLVGEVHSTTASYAADEQVYYRTTTNNVLTGNFYTANTSVSAGQTPDTNPEKWDMVEIPERLSLFLVHSAAAHWLSMQPGRDAERAEHYQLSAMHHHILKKATRYQDLP